ncbi:P-loop containing nucleoside triphosphate hydrolase [Synechococcus sp. ROS8604]|nr:P-loop containing nucleoside triphosphate hydrolase [Synechococcus sp. ROS8604]
MIKPIILSPFLALDSLLDTDYTIRVSNAFRGFHNNRYKLSTDDLCFVHVPKTAGTSIAKYFEVLREYAFGINICYKNHCPVSIYADPAIYKYTTCHRDPFERVWSYYQMSIRDCGNSYHKYTTHDSLEYFINHCWECRNMMTKYMTANLSDNLNNKSVQLARDNLKMFFWVFDFDNLTSSLELFTKKYFNYCAPPSMTNDIPVIPQFHSRSSSYRPPSREELLIIKYYNKYDISLFDLWKQDQCFS